MAFAVDVQLGTNSSPASIQTTITLTTTNAVAAGALIVVGMASVVRGGPVTLTFSGGSLTWTSVKQGGSASTDDIAGLGWALAPSGLAASTVITVTGSPTNEFPSTGGHIGGMSFTGVTSGTPLDTSAGASQSASASWAGGAITPAASGELVVGLGWGNSVATTNTPGAVAATQGWIKSANAHTLVFDYDLSGASGSQTPSGTFGASQTLLRGISGAFIPAAAGGVTFAELVMAPPRR